MNLRRERGSVALTIGLSLPALDLLDRHIEAQEAYRAVLVGEPHNVAARNDLALSLALTRQFGDACR